MMRRVLLAAAAAAAVLGGGAAQAAGSGVALVVGNNDYRNTGDLVNAGKDARDMAGALREAGFEVIEAYDADLVAFQTALTRFGRAIKPGEPAVVFYAGHGVQGIAPGGGIDSYLVPVDAEFPTPERIAAEAVALNEVLARLEQSGAGPRLVILDACRENVFGRKWQTGARGLARLSGLSAPASEKLRGVFIAYATSPGDVAADGKPGGNGLFTGAVLKHLRKPGQTVNALFGEVSAEVEAATNGDQQPWFSGSGTAGRLVLRTAGSPTTSVAAAAPAGNPAQRFLAENGATPGGMGEIARSYLWGENGLARNETEALKWARMAAEKGDVTGALILGHAYETGKWGVRRSLPELRRWYQRAAEAGDLDAMSYLGITYINGYTPEEMDAALRWGLLAAQAGHVKGMELAGSAYQYKAIAGDRTAWAEARRWWRLAAEKGSKSAQGSLTFIDTYLKEQAAPKATPEQVAAAIKETLPQPGGARGIGWAYLWPSSGFPLNQAEGRRWLERAAAGGDADAMDDLGQQYLSGSWGFPMDHRKAVDWLRRAAAKGNTNAMLTLGILHEEGRAGLPWSLSEAKSWYERAKQAGEPRGDESLAMLGGAHLQGRAGPRTAS